MDDNTKSAIVGGTFFSSVVNIGVEDVATTIILAVIGAIVSFFVSIILKYIFQNLKIKTKK
ncbi:MULTISPECIES: hypothetical protein [Flavobacteriaceae]|uniref:hypothetical protein n=1 Tax=Flavobacteriaceae TaxID=49546 RepID=UPI001C09E9CD|nr:MULTISPECIES: hypothetical protein [Flavobacteriaceae]MBU3012862.1 hypothetical protein [Polaribacter vadi]MDO6742678.1 hypothetical protein [Polaribacter sp. 1_MG-2023]|tara:strand:+ start:214 stop:396 length:183 start_codon:yes stop_codon:yes gene_type:complete